MLRQLQQTRNMGLVLITHNMGVVSEMAQRVAVMYAGQIMEMQAAANLFDSPRHPYTEALMAALPERNVGCDRLATIPGMVPGLRDRPAGCLFCTSLRPRSNRCNSRPVLQHHNDNAVRCHFPFCTESGPTGNTRWRPWHEQTFDSG